MKKRYTVRMGFPGKLPDLTTYVEANSEYEAIKLAEKNYPQKEVKSIEER